MTTLRSPTKVVEEHVQCSDCGSSDAKCVYDDGHGYCFSCTKYTPPDKSEFLDDIFTYEYLPLRGINKGTFEHFDCKTKIDSNGKPVSIGFRYPNDSYKIRTLPKGFYTQGDISKAGLFGRNKFTAGSHKYVTITEGELDALSLWQVLRSPVVSVHSSSSAQLDASLDRSWLNSFERIYLAFDADEQGRTAASKVAKLFDYNKVYLVRFPGGNRKDANDYVAAGEHDELKNLWWNAKKYLPDTIVSSFHDFDKIMSEKPKEGVAYPFPTLSHMTYGIRTGESVLITAQEGVGKTELMHAIEHQLLTETSDAIGAIFLEEPKRRHLQALAGIQLQRPVHLPDSGVTDTEVLSAAKEAIGEDDRLHIYSHFGSDDPEVILDTIRFLVSARNCRYILLDHITMVVSGLGGDNERRALDYLSTRLEMMVKELDFALIVVSHVNDDGLTRGSRNISKIADIRIDIKRDVTSSDPIIRRTTHLTVSKNRFCGRTGPAGTLLFDPITYTLSEDMGYGAPSTEQDNRRIEEMAS
jgi:twinkle protein